MGSIKSSPTADKCLVVFVADSIFPYQDQDSCTSEQGQSTLLLAGKDIHYLNNEFVSVGYNGILAYCGSGLGMQRGEEQMLSALLRNRDEQLCLKQKEQLQGIITSKYSEQILINSGVKHVEYGFCEDGVITDPMVMAARIHQQLGIIDPGSSNGGAQEHVIGQQRKMAQSKFIFLILRDVKFPADYTVPHEDACISYSLSILRWVNDLFQYLDKQPCFRETVLVSLVLECHGFNFPALEELAIRGCTSIIPRPPQSFLYRGSEVVSPDNGTFALVVQRLAGSTRKDLVQTLDLKEFFLLAGGKCILIERMIYELAYKMGLSLKYGA